MTIESLEQNKEMASPPEFVDKVIDVELERHVAGGPSKHELYDQQYGPEGWKVVPVEPEHNATGRFLKLTKHKLFGIEVIHHPE